MVSDVMMTADNYFDVLGTGNYTFTFFHLPFLKRIKDATVINDSVSGMAIKMPRGPIAAFFERYQASGICNTQNPNKFLIVGVHVSPAPWNAFINTIPTP